MSSRSLNHTPEPGRIENLAFKVARQLQNAGYVAFYAGGCVRDTLIGRTPKDYDIATSATPDMVKDIFPGALCVGKAFGVVRAPMENTWFEIATFRTEGDYKDGRHPETVAFSNPEEDARRRDFTVNALFLDPVSEEVYDFVGGEEDIQNKLIRCVGIPAHRFEEDHLRLLRAVRFASILNFTIEQETAAAIVQHAKSINHVSQERIRDEMLRILTEAPRPGDAVTMLESLGLLPFILPEVAATKGVMQSPQFHPEGDIFHHTTLMLNLFASIDSHRHHGILDPQQRSLLAMAILLHDIGKPPSFSIHEGRIHFYGHERLGAEMAEKALRRLRFSNADREAIVTIIAGHMTFKDVQNMRRSKLRALVASPILPLAMEMHRLDCMSSHGSLDNYFFMESALKEWPKEQSLPRPLISGHDILKLGVPCGPMVGLWHKRAFDAQLDGEFSQREEGLAWIERKINPSRCG